MASVDTDAFLSCEDDRFFWISWAGGFLQVGQNAINGLDSFMEYQDPTPMSVDLMHFHSYDYDLNCRWKMYYNQGGCCGQKEAIATVYGVSIALWTSFKTPVDFGYHYVWETVEHKQGIVFSVQACSDVHVILSDVVRVTDDRYDIVIGGWSNTKWVSG